MFQVTINVGKSNEPIQAEKTQDRNNIKSIELLYTIAQNEYSNEHERTNIIHSKAGIALPIISAYFLALIQMNDYKYMINYPVTNIWTGLIPVGLFISYTVGAILSLLSVVYMAKVVFAKNYIRLDPKSLCTENNLILEHKTFTMKMMGIYFNAIAFNIEANNDRMKLYKKSWIYIFGSVLSFVVYIVIKNNT